MDQLTERINNASCLDDLIPLIEAISRETEAMLGRNRLTERNFATILLPLAAMRSLLGRLDLLLSDPGSVSAAQAAVIRELAARCLDLEGRIKEKRNDRLRPNYAV